MMLVLLFCIRIPLMTKEDLKEIRQVIREELKAMNEWPDETAYRVLSQRKPL